jgi:hypothetical protein
MEKAVDVFLLRGVSEGCREWLRENVAHTLTWTGGLLIEHRFLDDILSGLQGAGFATGTDFDLATW